MGLGQEGVPKAHCKWGELYRCQENQTLGALLVGRADTDNQETLGGNKAKVAWGYSEYKNQVALAPQTLED